jgi:hypothetical protein
MNICKLKYTDKETAIADLITKNVIDMEGNYQQGIQAVVEIGLIVLQEGIYDEDLNIITEPIYDDGYYYDVMCIQTIDFGINEVFPKNAKHSFMGYDINADGNITNKNE